jgi:hypothetical protein
VIRRYEREVVGELIHVDVKKFGKTPTGGGWGIRGRQGTGPRQKVGYTYLRSAVDDRSRLAYSEFLSDETANTAICFMHRAVEWFNRLGVLI